MSRIKKNVQVHQLEGETLFGAYLAKPDSCAILISYSGGTRNVLKAASLLSRNNIPIIAITSLGENELTEQATVSLRIATKEKLYSKIGTFSTDLSITYLLDVLYGCLFSQNYDHNVYLRKKASEIIELSRVANSSILKEDD